MTHQCPSAAWDDYCQQNDFPDDICFECHVHIGESPKGDSLIEDIVFDDGFCSIKCREAELLKMRGRMLLLTHIDGVLSYAQGLRAKMCLPGDYRAICGKRFANELPVFESVTDLSNDVLAAVNARVEARLFMLWRNAFRQRCVKAVVALAINAMQGNYYQAGLAEPPKHTCKQMIGREVQHG